MSLSDHELLQGLCALFLLLASALLCGRLFARLRLPVAMGEIFGGLLLGPTVLGALVPEAAGWLFPASGPTASALGLIYQLGLLLLMFLGGAQMRVVLTRHHARTVSAVAIAGMVIPFALGLAFALMVDQSSIIGTGNSPAALTLVIAVAVAITSIPVISRIMMDLGIMRTRFARIVLSVAVLEDIVLTVLISIAVGILHGANGDAIGLQGLLGLESTGAAIAYHTAVSLAFLTAAALVARLAGRRLSQGATGAMSIGPVLVVVGATSAACVGLGIAPFLGAFVVGLVYGRALANDLHLRSIEAFSLAFFIPLFFAIVGLKLDLFKDLDVTFTALFIAFAFVAKGSGVYLGARLARTEGSGSLNLAIALNARGGPGIVLATVGLNAGIINDMFFTTLIMTAVLTSLLAGWWLQIAVGRGLLSTADAPPRTVAELAV